MPTKLETILEIVLISTILFFLASFNASLANTHVRADGLAYDKSLSSPQERSGLLDKKPKIKS